MAKQLAHTIKALMHGKRGTRGESLVEVLTSIVIGGLALLMLGMAISSASRMAIDSREAMTDYYQASNAIASGSATSLGTGTVALTQDGASVALVSSGESIAAAYYQSDGLGSATVVLYEAGDAAPAGGGA